MNKDKNSDFRKQLYNIGDKVIYLNYKAEIIQVNKRRDHIDIYYNYHIRYKIPGNPNNFAVNFCDYWDLTKY